MDTAVMQRKAIERRRQAEFEAYQHWEYQRRQYDEITDVAERVRAPLAVTQEFDLTPNGLVSARGEPLLPIIEDGIADAKRMAAMQPDWQVEYERRLIDRDEYYALETLATHQEGQGAMVSYWLIPDAVRSGSNLPGYNRDRLKMFTRVAVPTQRGIAIKYHSYDLSYKPGLVAMDQALGSTFDTSRSSEQVARERRYLPWVGATVDGIDEMLRHAYDSALARDKGGEWSGGRPPLATQDVIGFISEQKDLLGNHMAELTKIFSLTLDPYERNRLMEPHRYNLAAAIDDLLHGKKVTTAVEAGDNARSEGRNLDRDCPTGTDDEASAAEQLGSLGFKGKNRYRILAMGECRTCLYEKAVVVNECNMCLDCENVHSNEGNIGLDRIVREAKERVRAKNKRPFAGFLKVINMVASKPD
ncbi:MAG TPA: hypothetical protein VFO38_04140 [Candidatus Saccharimonadales bacterium]|nr:hypothetical protein [Candidatus Saccharimonadales bacterium]